jgi:hypothetical protein
MVCPPQGDVMTDFTPIGNVNCDDPFEMLERRTG